MYLDEHHVRKRRGHGVYHLHELIAECIVVEVEQKGEEGRGLYGPVGAHRPPAVLSHRF